MSDSKKRRSGLGQQQSVVQRLIGESERRQKEEATDGRGRPGHAGQVGQDKQGRSKVTYNIPLDRQALVREMAQDEDVSQADIVEAAIVALHNAWQAGKVDFHLMKNPARSLRVSWKLTIPDEFTPDA